MFPYIIFYIFVFMFASFDVYKGNIQQKTAVSFKGFLLLSALLFFALPAFRYKTGIDWNAYETIFQTSLSNPSARWETGYIFINQIFRHISEETFLMYFVISAFQTICVYHFICKYSPMPFMSLFCYAAGIYFQFHMGYNRQGIAISFFLLAFDARISNKMLKAVALIVIACFIHISAITYFIIFIINGKTYNRYITFVLVLISLILFSQFIVYQSVMRTLAGFPIMPKLLSAMLANFYSQIPSSFGGWMGYIPRRIVIFFILFFIKPKDKTEILLYKVMAVGLMMEAFGFAAINAYRVALTFIIMENVLLCRFLVLLKNSRSNKKWFYLISYGIVLFYVAWGPYNFFTNSKNVMLNVYRPYYSVFLKPQTIIHGSWK